VLGGWYHNYDFVGDLDECRISRSRVRGIGAAGIRKPETAANAGGTVVPAGSEFSVSPGQTTVAGGKERDVFPQGWRARKVYWILKRDGYEAVVATDRFAFTFEAGRVTGDQAATLQFKAVYANEVKTRDMAIAIKEDIQEPVFTLQAPAAWDGRTAIEVVPRVTNLSTMQAKGAGELKMEWNVSGIAVIKDAAPGKLVLKRAQNSGTMTVTATLSNGGQPATAAVTIAVTEPKTDAWLARHAAKEEQPVDNQFYARDDRNEGTLYYNGTLDQPADSVFLKVYADDKIFKTESQKPAADKTYAFAIKLQPGLIKYRWSSGQRLVGARPWCARPATWCAEMPTSLKVSPMPRPGRLGRKPFHIRTRGFAVMAIRGAAGEMPSGLAHNGGLVIGHGFGHQPFDDLQDAHLHHQRGGGRHPNRRAFCAMKPTTKIPKQFTGDC